MQRNNAPKHDEKHIVGVISNQTLQRTCRTQFFYLSMCLLFSDFQVVCFNPRLYETHDLARGRSKY